MLTRRSVASVLALLLSASACAPAPKDATSVTTTTAAKTEAPADTKAADPQDTKVVRGRVLDFEGKPLAESYARVIGPGNKVLVESKVDDQGAFVVSLKDGDDRVRRVDVSGPGYKTRTLLVATDTLPVEVTVQLGAFVAPADVAAIELNVSPMPNAWSGIKDVKKGDGFYEGETKMPDGPYPFRIIAKQPGYPVLTDGYLTVKDGKTKVAFDLAHRPPSGFGGDVTWADPETASAGLTDIRAEVDRIAADIHDKQMTSVANGRPATAVASGYPFAEPRALFEAVSRTGRHAIVREAGSVAYFLEGSFSSPSSKARGLAQRTIAAVGPTDSLWSVLDPVAFSKVAPVAGERFGGDYAKRFVAENTDNQAVAYYLAEEMRSAKGDLARGRAIGAALREDRFKGNWVARSALQLDPDSPVAVGKPAPAFEAKALLAGGLDEDTVYTPATFQNKVYLLDVWATWCKPCVAELPELHRLYAKYGSKKAHKRGKRLEIVSVSIGEEPSTVAEFRRDKAHPMPWRVGIAGDEARKNLFKNLGFSADATSVPFYVLVDESGRIIASSPELNSATLGSTITRVMGR